MDTYIFKQLSILRVGTFIIVPILLLFVCGCDWDPERNNPLDPGSPKYRSERVGSLHVRVMRLNQVYSIANAEVEILSDPALSKQTDPDGWVYFSAIPEGIITVRASADMDRDTIYASSTRQVDVSLFDTTEALFYLDALPIFNSAVAHSVTIEADTGQFPNLNYWVHLKARVEDPDGPHDLTAVEWAWENTISEPPLLLSGEMLYQRDSSFFDTLIPGDAFGNIDLSLDWPFTLQAIDGQGHVTQSDPVRVIRIIHDAPGFTESYKVKQTLLSNPELFWSFSYLNSFVSREQFNFVLKIFQTGAGSRMVYDTLIAPRVDSPVNGRHIVEVDLSTSEYEYEWWVWAIDLHGNSCRSVTARIIAPQ